MLSSVCLKIEMEKPAPIVWHSAHWEPKMQHVWRGALLLLSFWSLLQSWSKPSLHKRPPPALFKSDFTYFWSLIQRQNSSLSSQWIIEREVQFYGPRAKLLPETRVLMEAYSPTKGAWIWCLASIQLQDIIHMITAGWGDEAQSENIIMFGIFVNETPSNSFLPSKSKIKSSSKTAQKKNMVQKYCNSTLVKMLCHLP